MALGKRIIRRSIVPPRTTGTKKRYLPAPWPTNELGLFYAGNVREPYSKIRGKPMDIAHYATHLSEFCSEDRGRALLKTGKPKRYQYRFANPMLQPLVVMMGVRDKLITLEDASLSTARSQLF